MTPLSDEAVGRLREATRTLDLSGTRYRLVRRLGAGGMGAVYEALDTTLGRHVALKLLDVPEGAGDLEARLLGEAKVLARLEHPGIVPVHDAGTLPDGQVFYAMKLVQGDRLDRHAARVAARAERLRLFLRVCEPVAFAHARGILHRDLKPENVMVGPFGEVLVMDWGLAKSLDGEDDATRAPAGTGRPGTAAGAVLGTPGYMAPEQAAGRAVDVRADVFALGRVLDFLLAVEDGKPPAPVVAIIARATAPDPDARYGAVTALAEDVSRFLDGEPVGAYPEGPFLRALRLLKRHRVAVLLVAAYLVARGLILFFLPR